MQDSYQDMASAISHEYLQNFAALAARVAPFRRVIIFRNEYGIAEAMPRYKPSRHKIDSKRT
jgi:hypothetical protein